MPPSNVPDTLMVVVTLTVPFAAGNVGMVIAPSTDSASLGRSPPQDASASAQATAVTVEDTRARGRLHFIRLLLGGGQEVRDTVASLRRHSSRADEIAS